MSVLLLRLAGPMQSWGTHSRFSIRDTGLEPSKSGVLGLLCAALGRDRNEDISDLANLRMGVRVDHEGILKYDYHTALNVARAGGSTPKDCEPSTRYYLADADFLIGLEGEYNILEKIQKGEPYSLSNPKWQLFLGRKAFVPCVPVIMESTEDWPNSINDKSLKDCLFQYPWEPRKKPWQNNEEILPEEPGLRLVIETEYGKGTVVRHDQIISSFTVRRFMPRHVIIDYLPPEKIVIKEGEPCTFPV